MHTVECDVAVGSDACMDDVRVDEVMSRTAEEQLDAAVLRDGLLEVVALVGEVGCVAVENVHVGRLNVHVLEQIGPPA